ncbi:hypothetical protein THAOC_07357, partial [Thalassiosira oceanica]
MIDCHWIADDDSSLDNGEGLAEMELNENSGVNRDIAGRQAGHTKGSTIGRARAKPASGGGTPGVLRGEARCRQDPTKILHDGNAAATAVGIEEWLPETDIELASLVDDPTISAAEEDTDDDSEEEGITSDAGGAGDFGQPYPSEDGVASAGEDVANRTSRCSCRRGLLFACVLGFFVVPALVLASKSGTLGISQISSIGSVSTDGPIAPSSSRQVKAGRLVAITNEEGITAQKVTLESFMRLAYVTRRNLLLIPFQSEHYKDSFQSPLLPQPYLKKVFVRLEDYIDNATESLNWHTMDPYEPIDQSLLEMIRDPVNNCIRGNYVQNGFTSIIKNNSTNEPYYQEVWFPPDRGQGDATPSLQSIAAEIDLKRNESDACVAGRIIKIAPQFRKPFPLNWSSPVTELAQRGIRSLLSKSNGSGNLTSIVTLHLRRGDKCTKYPRSVACAPADRLPFLDLCENMRQDGKGMYVSTNEDSPIVLQKLRDSNCLLAEDLHMNFMEEAERLNSRNPDA